MFTKVNPHDDPVRREHDILAFWKERRIFEKLVARNAHGPAWSFLDGPITANNPMGVHHAWGRSYKDCFQRYQAMTGHRLRYQNGFDCQGLWVEVEVEKELGFTTKHDIEEFGIEKFVEKCKERVRRFARIQTEQSVRLGYWMDWANSYCTMSDENNYAIWAFLAKCHERRLIYKGADCMPWCPRCGTGISQHEMHEGYRDVDDTAVFVCFALVNKPGEFLLVWTTTPWTLAANVACAVNPELTYERVRQGDRAYYVAAALTGVLSPGGDSSVTDRLQGKDMVGWAYQGPFDELPAQAQFAAGHRVVGWSDVSGEEGTGIVHIAPGCGKEDFDLGRVEGLPVLAPVDESGTYVEGYGSLTGKSALAVSGEVIDSLRAKGLLVRTAEHRHSYPHCWRCGTPLLFRYVHEWFIEMSWRDKIKEHARQARWIPEWGLARELDWLDNMRDWMISKKRYWGLALPIYECGCGWFDVIGSKDDLRKRAVEGWEAFEGRSPHRPWIDNVKIRCGRCGATVKRIADVGNPWLDAGIVPYSTLRYGEDREYWRQWMPADLVVECFPGQFRNWFYALLAMSTMMEDLPPFKTLFGHAAVKDERGEEMHKSKGNAVWFDDAAEKMGADVMRWMFCRHNPAENLNFGFASGKELVRTFFNTWRNVYAFFCNYARLDGFDPAAAEVPVARRPDIDRWILSDLHLFLRDAAAGMSGYDAAMVTRRAEQFVERLSNWYVRRGRRRFWRERTADDLDKLAAYQTLHHVLVALAQALAPIVPFVTEDMYRNLSSGDPSGAESVHLCRYPRADASLIDERLSTEMSLVVQLVSEALSLRQLHAIRVRQPLAELSVACSSQSIAGALHRFEDDIRDEANVKNLRVVCGRPGATAEGDAGQSRFAMSSCPQWTLRLDIQVTEDLAAEGMARDLVRHIQVLRKDKGFELADRIAIFYRSTSQGLRDAVVRWADHIKAETLATRLEDAGIDEPDRSVSIGGQSLSLTIRKA